jgi:hypothetical protein
LKEVFIINSTSNQNSHLLEKDIEKRVSYEKDIQTPPRTHKKKHNAPEKVISVVFFLIVLSNLVYMAVAFMHH